MMKKIEYFLEFIPLFILMLILKALPLDTASSFGSWFGRTVGPHLRADKTARRNLAAAMPELSDPEREKIITAMWDNLGRIMAEYPHLEKLGKERVIVICGETAEKIFKEDKPFLMMSGHIGSWEIIAAGLLMQRNRPMDLTYRAPNNPWVDAMLMKMRALDGKIKGYAKSRTGAQEIIRAMGKDRTIGMLIDQKYGEGIAIPFFGRPAMTNPAFVKLARKFDYPIIPTEIERTNGAHFTLTLHEPLKVEGKEMEEIIIDAHSFLEECIRKRPAQWLWVHRRWDSQQPETLKKAA